MRYFRKQTYTSITGGSANNVPLHNVQCTADNRCRAKCCSPNYTFLPRRNYTFQMSTLLTIDKVAKISPLSDQISVVSWDGGNFCNLFIHYSALGFLKF